MEYSWKKSCFVPILMLAHFRSVVFAATTREESAPTNSVARCSDLISRRQSAEGVPEVAIAHEFSTRADPDELTPIVPHLSQYSIPNRDNTGTHPLRVIDPAVFEPTDKQGLVRFFRDNGYVVVDHVSQTENRDAVVELMDKVAEAVPQARRLGFMDLYHDDALAQMRQNQSLYQVFADIFGREELWVVFDRVMYWNSNEGEKPLPPHVDQNPIQHPGFFNVQAMLALRDMNEGTGTLALVPKSHLCFQEYSQWTKPNAGFVEYQGTEALPFVALRLREGQIVIWDSRTTHSRFRGDPSGTRYAALLTFTPA
ncbi:MAG: phytanoyl-CoA dioxygenase family protein [Bdellovibrionales bacterium]|nr:phytanoyl-CoA dioxygenase family protein [Bdellovibrionales bacterium]